MYRSTKTREAIAEAARVLELDPRTIYGWYVPDLPDGGSQFANWVSSAFKGYHAGMVELFTTKLYKRGQADNASIKEEQAALAAALKVVASLTKKPPKSEEDDNSDGVFKRLMKADKSG